MSLKNKKLSIYQFGEEESKLDKRIIKTKRKVLDTLLKEFDAEENIFIYNISFLCQEAGINRTTFYDNFHDADGLNTYIQNALSYDLITEIEENTKGIKDFKVRYYAVLSELVDALEKNANRLYKAFKQDFSQTIYGMMNYLVATLILEIFELREDNLECNAKVRMIAGGLNYYLYYEFREKNHSQGDVIKKNCFDFSQPFFDCFLDFKG